MIQKEERESLLRPDGSTEDIKVDPFFGYAYRTVGTEQYYDCLMTKGEYDELLSEINQLEESDAKTAFIELVNEIYYSVEDYTALAQAADELMDDTAEVITKVLQLVQPLQQYKSWDGVLNDMGVAASDSAPSAAQLEGNDFTQVGSSWCKLGDDGGFTVAWPNGYDGGGQTQPPAGTGSGGQYSGNAMVSASSLKEAEIGNWSDQVRAAGGHALGIGADLLEKRAEMNLAKNKSARNVMRNTSVNERTQPIRDKLWKKMEARDAMINSDMDKALMCKTLGVGLSLYNIKSDADQLNENIVKTAESEAKTSELDVLIQYYTTHVAPAGCLSALQDEREAYDLLNDLMNQKSKHMMLNVGVGVASLALSATTASISSTAAMTYDAASGVAMYSRDVLIA